MIPVIYLLYSGKDGRYRQRDTGRQESAYTQWDRSACGKLFFEWRLYQNDGTLYVQETEYESR